jgi:hypothetical protein
VAVRAGRNWICSQSSCAGGQAVKGRGDERKKTSVAGGHRWAPGAIIPLDSERASEMLLHNASHRLLCMFERGSNVFKEVL